MTQTLKQAIRQAIREHGDSAIWSDGGTDWTLDNYLNSTIEEHASDDDHRDYVLCESADGWSLHAPGSTNDEIASGAARYIVSGPWEGGATERQITPGAYDDAHAVSCALYENAPAYYDGKTIRLYRADGTLDTGEALLRLKS